MMFYAVSLSGDVSVVISLQACMHSSSLNICLLVVKCAGSLPVDGGVFCESVRAEIFLYSTCSSKLELFLGVPGGGGIKACYL